MKRLCCVLCFACFIGLLLGCGQTSQVEKAPAGMPSFSLAWSEYPSWSVYGVASEKGIIDGRQGWIGPVEKKWGVDITLKEADYDSCIGVYGQSLVSAACLTTLDALAPSLRRDSVVICPTSTSVGADKCIVVGIQNVDELKGKSCLGPEKTVAQFVFERNVVLLKKDPKEFPFKNMDPAAAAQAMQQSQKNIHAIQVWNPFALQTLRTRDGAKVLFDSSTIPEEVIDSLVVGKDVLSQPGGDRFACAIIDTYYSVCRSMADPKEGDATHVALGRKFSNLGLADMRICCKETSFYSTPEKGLTLFNSPKFRQEITPLMVDFCVGHDIVKQKPVVGFAQRDAQLNFDDTYMKQVQNAK